MALNDVYVCSLHETHAAHDPTYALNASPTDLVVALDLRVKSFDDGHDLWKAKKVDDGYALWKADGRHGDEEMANDGGMERALEMSDDEKMVRALANRNDRKTQNVCVAARRVVHERIRLRDPSANLIAWVDLPQQ